MKGRSANFLLVGLGARVSAVENGYARTFRRDGDTVTDPVLSDGASAFTPGISVRNGGSSRFFFDDRMGTATKETDSAQLVTATRTYDAFGSMVASSGSSPSPFGYAGGYGYQEDATGLKLLGHRYYDPTTGRFLTRDPIRDGSNWYSYCSNNPLRWVDPDGRIASAVVMVAAGAAFGAIFGAFLYPEDRWRGAGIGAAGGAIGGLVGGLVTAGAAGLLGLIPLTGAVGGLISGGIGGFAGGAACQLPAIWLGDQEEVYWSVVGVSALGGGIGGALCARPVPARGPVQVSHWGHESPWVQVGPPTRLNHIRAGSPEGEVHTEVISAKLLAYPKGIEWGKGVFGQRIRIDWSGLGGSK